MKKKTITKILILRYTVNRVFLTWGKKKSEMGKRRETVKRNVKMYADKILRIGHTRKRQENPN